MGQGSRRSLPHMRTGRAKEAETREEDEAWFERNDAIVEIDLLEEGDGTVR